MAARRQDGSAEPGTRRRGNKTATRILDSAERLVQVRGFNGFSYADVADELGVTKASLHYHFPTKTALGQALVERYAERFTAALTAIESRMTEAPARLDAYAGLYADVLRERRMCLCGMLAAEYGTLPDPIRERVIGFFDDNETWLARVLEHGRVDGGLRFDEPPHEAARLIVSGLEGAMLVARSYGDIERFHAAATGLLATVTRPASPRGEH